ncbi:MAG: hypothetical protein WDZ38_04125 [Balneolaceae bacterium]
MKAQRVHTYVDTDSVMVGDRFNYILVFEGDYNSITFPDESAFEEEIELISRERYQISEQKDSLVYHLQFFGTDNLIIDRKAISLTSTAGDTTVYSTIVPLQFKTTLTEGDEDFRQLKPIFDFARSWLPIVIMIILMAVAAYYLFNWYRKREIHDAEIIDETHTPEPFMNPLDELRDRINGLKEISELQKLQDYEAFYIQLGDAIRAYLKRVYAIPALEMTTREIIDGLHKELAPSDIISITRSVLNEADMVKFANFMPVQDQAGAVLNKAYKFIETAAIVNHEQIRYMKYKYEEKHGLRNSTTLTTEAE